MFCALENGQHFPSDSSAAGHYVSASEWVIPPAELTESKWTAQQSAVIRTHHATGDGKTF